MAHECTHFWHDLTRPDVIDFVEATARETEAQRRAEHIVPPQDETADWSGVELWPDQYA